MSNEWEAKAVCRDHDPELWFPGRNESHIPAATLCFTCPVIRECRQWAEQSGQGCGVWGGKDFRAPRAERKGCKWGHDGTDIYEYVTESGKKTRTCRECVRLRRGFSSRESAREARVEHQRQVAKLTAAGYSSEEIGQRLGISARTVLRYRSSRVSAE
jgi:WhiB family redox-sensing transcriptional regulator